METMVNLLGDELTIIETWNNIILQFENGKEKTFSSYEKALQWAYKHGFEF